MHIADEIMHMTAYEIMQKIFLVQAFMILHI